jgi:hypothetical protein
MNPLQEHNMQKTHTWYEGIIIGIAFLIGVGLSFAPLITLFMPPGNKVENFPLLLQLMIMVAGPLAYIISLLIYPRTAADNYGVAVWRKCFHAVFFAIAMIWIPFSLETLAVILHPLFVHFSFPTLPLPAIFPLTPFWESIIDVTPLAAYFGVLGYIEWRLHRNHVAIFTIAFGIFTVTVNFTNVLADMLRSSRAAQSEYVPIQSGKVKMHRKKMEKMGENSRDSRPNSCILPS